MILDTTVLVDLQRELRRKEPGGATALLERFGDEQVAIANALDHMCGEIDATIDRVSRENTLLLEYRARLLADVVTGKLDVRDAAAALPHKNDFDDEDDQDDILDVDTEIDVDDIEEAAL